MEMGGEYQVPTYHHSIVPISKNLFMPSTPGGGGAAIAQWIHLRLPSCRPGFESQANHLSFYFIYSQICAIIVNVLLKERK